MSLKLATAGTVLVVACAALAFPFLVRLVSVPAPPPRVAGEPKLIVQNPTVTAPAAPKHWVVRVDGWSLQFNDAEPGTLPSLRSSGPEDTPEAEEFSSPYDDLIARESRLAGLDWRLVSAVIYEESRFQPDAESDKGAYGLMQVRDIAARDVGVDSYRSPEENIHSGVLYLQRLADIFSAASGRDRLALMLAAYNMGPAHLEDAQGLARRFGYNPLRWDDSMDLMLPLLEQPAVFEALPSGYAQGTATVAYVNRILDRYVRDPRRFAIDQAASASS